MPGVVGMISQIAPGECDAMVSSMLAVMRHEPFYDSGGFACFEQGVFAGWIAHADSFATGRPFRNQKSDIELILCG